MRPSYEYSDDKFRNAFRHGMKADIVLMRQGSGVVIVDAKYYDPAAIYNSPRWGDIGKQFFYKKALKAAVDVSSIRNVFIFPGVDGPYTSVHLRSKKDGKKDYDAVFHSR